MPDFRKPLALFLAFGLAAPALAQDDAPTIGDAPTGDGLSLGEEADQTGSGTAGQSYVEAEFGDWQMRCVSSDEGEDPCQLYQLLQDQEGNSVAEISLFPLPDGGQAVAGATIVTPLETLLTQQVTLQVDDGEAKRYPFTWCSAIGCVARVGFTAEEVESFRRGVEIAMTIVPVAAPDQEVELSISLIGFTDGFAAVSERLAN
ncbi:invasion associated locus B family protein [Rhodobacteraceae bacterium WD3A24]|nr:invasion associated locus B family protein [Rhodobacteraceae bacterium WD3A24]